MFCRVLGISYISDNSLDKIDNLTFLPTTVKSFVSVVCVITLFRTFITKINRIWVQEFYLAPGLVWKRSILLLAMAFVAFYQIDEVLSTPTC